MYLKCFVYLENLFLAIYVKNCFHFLLRVDIAQKFAKNMT